MVTCSRRHTKSTLGRGAALWDAGLTAGDADSSVESAGGNPVSEEIREIRCREIRCQFIILARKVELTPDFPRHRISPPELGPSPPPLWMAPNVCSSFWHNVDPWDRTPLRADPIRRAASAAARRSDAVPRAPSPTRSDRSARTPPIRPPGPRGTVGGRAGPAPRPATRAGS